MKHNQSKLKLLTMGIVLTTTLILSGCSGNGTGNNDAPPSNQSNDNNQSNGNTGNDNNQSNGNTENDNNQSNGNTGNDNNQSNGNTGNDNNQSTDNTDDNQFDDNVGNNTSSTKQVSDAYIVGTLTKRAIATCGFSRYLSERTIGQKGQLTFPVDFTNKTNCIISLEANSSKMDINNNGKIDENDTFLQFALSAPAEANYVTPLTTLYIQKIEAGVTKEELKTFKNLVFDFDPVAAATNVVKESNATAKLQLQKLMVTMEVLKVAMKNDANITELPLDKVTSSEGTLADFNVTNLIAGLSLSNEVKAKVKAKAETIQSIVLLLDLFNTTKVDLNTFMVSISDGNKTLKDAFKASLKDEKFANTITSRTSFETIISSVKKTDISNSLVATISTNFKAINSNIANIINEDFSAITIVNNTIIINIINDNTTNTPAKLTLGSSLALGSKTVTISKDTPVSLTVAKGDPLANFYDISLLDSQVDKTFNEQKVTLYVKVIDNSDANQYVTLKIVDINLSTDDGNSLQTKFVANQTSVQVEEMVSGVKKTYSATLQSDLVNSDLRFNVQTIINTLNNSQITNGIDRMNGYLNHVGEYGVTIELSGLDATEITTDFTTIEGTVTVQ